MPFNKGVLSAPAHASAGEFLPHFVRAKDTTTCYHKGTEKIGSSYRKRQAKHPIEK